jgi:HlyD family secretion protein
VIIDVPNPDLKLLPGLTANITVLISEVKDVLKVPATALRFSPPQEYIDEMMKNLPDSVKKKRERWSRMGGQGGSQGMGGGMPGGMQGNMQRSPRPGSDRPLRGSFGMVWVKVGDSIKPARVRTGVTDGLNTEVRGRIEEGAEVVLSMTVPGAQTSQQQQQQNPFAPQMQRGGSPRGGR